jgi:predicted enzyme involved in methoxymalonyl-ACP biosynthesis
VESSAPEVLAVPLPLAPQETGHFLEHIWAFDHPVVTDEDRNRNAYYSQSRQFGAEILRTSSLEQFMANLDLRVRIAPLTPDRLARVAQLTQRTNQFNFTGLRRSESDIQRLIEGGAHQFFTVDVSDRFGDYGLVGVMIVASGADLHLDTFLLSCRVLGRGVEHRMMAFLAGLGGTVDARLIPTKKNAPAQQFLDSIAGALKSESDGEWTYRFPSEIIHGLEWKPAAAVASPAPVDGTRPIDNKQRPPDYVRIAQTLSLPSRRRTPQRPRRFSSREPRASAPPVRASTRGNRFPWMQDKRSIHQWLCR